MCALTHSAHLTAIIWPFCSSVTRFGKESDARFGSFDFRAAHEQAPADLQELLDNDDARDKLLQELELATDESGE